MGCRHPFVSSMLRLTVLVVVIVYHCDMPLNTFTYAKLLVVPLWNASHGTSESCHLDENSDGSITLQGSPYHSCNLQVESPPDSLVSIGIPSNRIDLDYSIVVARKGDNVECPNNYVLISRQSKDCKSLFKHNHLEFNMYGNVNISLKEVLDKEVSLFECPESEKPSEIRMELNHSCVNVKGSEKAVTCTTNDEQGQSTAKIQDFCEIKFNSNCSALLADQEVHFHCQLHNNTQSLLLIYPSGISELSLIQNNIVEIDPKAFQHVRGLKKIDLDDNQLVDLPYNVFSGLNQLTHLNISNNNLSALPAFVFNAVENLIELRFENNKLKTLESHLFQNLKQLTNLCLCNNEIRELPDGLFQELHLYTLHLYLNNLKSLHSVIFRDLTELEELDLYGNMLTDLPEDLFRELKHLVVLSLGCNQLKKLPCSIFRGLSRVTTLDVSYNQLHSLSRGIQREFLANICSSTTLFLAGSGNWTNSQS